MRTQWMPMMNPQVEVGEYVESKGLRVIGDEQNQVFLTCLSLLCSSHPNSRGLLRAIRSSANNRLCDTFSFSAILTSILGGLKLTPVDVERRPALS